MRKIFVFIAIMPLFLMGQDRKKYNGHKNISIGFSFSPDYTYRTLINNDRSSSSETIIDVRNKIEKGKFGFTTGFNLNIPLSTQFELTTGVLYSNKGYEIKEQDLYYPQPSPSDPTKFESNYNYNYLDIPIKLNFSSGKGKTKFIAGAGVAANFFLKQSEKIVFTYQDGSQSKTKEFSDIEFNKFNISSLISIGIQYILNDKTFLRAEPTFRYGFLKIVDQPVAERLWNVGLNIGLYVGLDSQLHLAFFD